MSCLSFETIHHLMGQYLFRPPSRICSCRLLCCRYSHLTRRNLYSRHFSFLAFLRGLTTDREIVRQFDISTVRRLPLRARPPYLGMIHFLLTRKIKIQNWVLDIVHIGIGISYIKLRERESLIFFAPSKVWQPHQNNNCRSNEMNDLDRLR